MDELVAFLKARLAEDEMWARHLPDEEAMVQGTMTGALSINHVRSLRMVANTARVLREVEAKRTAAEVIGVLPWGRSRRSRCPGTARRGVGSRMRRRVRGWCCSAGRGVRAGRRPASTGRRSLVAPVGRARCAPRVVFEERARGVGLEAVDAGTGDVPAGSEEQRCGPAGGAVTLDGGEGHGRLPSAAGAFPLSAARQRSTVRTRIHPAWRHGSPG